MAWRSIVRVRFSPYDGQHRWQTMSGCMQGIVQASNEVPLEFCDVGDISHELSDNVDTWQVWNTLRCILGRPALLESGVADLRQRSANMTKASKIRIEMGFYELVQSVLEKTSENWNEWKLVPLTFDHYWSPRVKKYDTPLSVNANKVLTNLVREAETIPGMKRLYMGLEDSSKASDSEVDERFDRMVSALRKKLKQIICAPKSINSSDGSNKISVQGVDGIPRRMYILFGLLKALVSGVYGLQLLGELSQKSEFPGQRERQQRQVSMQDYQSLVAYSCRNS